VRDTGGGIPSENLDHIFDGFFSTKTDSIGIGLAICRSIVDDHGGTISAANDDDDVGACFRIALPISARNDLHYGTFYSSSATQAPDQPA
jgi:signal transduction histidine kinase